MFESLTSVPRASGKEMNPKLRPMSWEKDVIDDSDGLPYPRAFRMPQMVIR